MTLDWTNQKCQKKEKNCSKKESRSNGSSKNFTTSQIQKWKNKN